MNIPKYMLCAGERVEILSRGSFEDSFVVRELSSGRSFEVEYKQLSPLENSNASTEARPNSGR